MEYEKKYECLKSASIKHAYYLLEDKAFERRMSLLNSYFFGEKDKNDFDWMIDLNGLCSIHSCQAVALIFEGQSIKKLRATYAYLKCYINCNLKIPSFFSSVHSKYSYFEGRISDICFCLILASIYDDKPMLTEGLSLLEGLKKKNFSEKFIADMTYVDFVSNLVRIRLSQELVNVSFDTNFNEVFKSWENVSELKLAVEDILDYHLFVGQPGKSYRSEEHEKYYPDIGYSSPFDTYDLSVMPYEVIAIYKIRQRQGLPFPEIDHPLLPNDMLSLFKEEFMGDYSDNLLDEIYSFINSKD